MRPEADVPQCPHCGAPLPIDFESPSVHCRSCRQATPLDAGLRAAMLRYVGDARKALEQDLAARWEAAYFRNNERATTIGVVATVGVAVSLVGLFSAFVFTGDTTAGLSWILSVALWIVWLPSLVFLCHCWRLIFRPISLESLRAMETAICSECGASTGFEAGRPRRCCRHCRSSALVPSDVASRLLGLARVGAEQSKVDANKALDDANLVGQRLVAPVVTVLIVVVAFAVVAIAVFGQPAGATIPVWVSGAVFGASFAASLPFFIEAVRSAKHSRDAVDEALARWEASR